jgi:hypothetical protein
VIVSVGRAVGIMRVGRAGEGEGAGAGAGDVAEVEGIVGVVCVAEWKLAAFRFVLAILSWRPPERSCGLTLPVTGPKQALDAVPPQRKRGTAWAAPTAALYPPPSLY